MLTYAAQREASGLVGADPDARQGDRRHLRGTHFTCFASAKVQILTKQQAKAGGAEPPEPSLGLGLQGERTGHGLADLGKMKGECWYT